jgi:hypothetical protein
MHQEQSVSYVKENVLLSEGSERAEEGAKGEFPMLFRLKFLEVATFSISLLGPPVLNFYHSDTFRL